MTKLLHLASFVYTYLVTLLSVSLPNWYSNIRHDRKNLRVCPL